VCGMTREVLSDWSSVLDRDDFNKTFFLKSSSQPLLICITLSQNAALSSVLGESISVDYKRVSKEINI